MLFLERNVLFLERKTGFLLIVHQREFPVGSGYGLRDFFLVLECSGRFWNGGNFPIGSEV